jgi:hypothetical protein
MIFSQLGLLALVVLKGRTRGMKGDNQNSRTLMGAGRVGPQKRRQKVCQTAVMQEAVRTGRRRRRRRRRMKGGQWERSGSKGVGRRGKPHRMMVIVKMWMRVGWMQMMRHRSPPCSGHLALPTVEHCRR